MKSQNVNSTDIPILFTEDNTFPITVYNAIFHLLEVAIFATRKD